MLQQEAVTHNVTWPFDHVTEARSYYKLKMYSSTFTRLTTTKLGKVITYGRDHHSPSLMTLRSHCYLKSCYNSISILSLVLSTILSLSFISNTISISKKPMTKNNFTGLGFTARGSHPLRLYDHMIM